MSTGKRGRASVRRRRNAGARALIKTSARRLSKSEAPGGGWRRQLRCRQVGPAGPSIQSPVWRRRRQLRGVHYWSLRPPLSHPRANSQIVLAAPSSRPHRIPQIPGLCATHVRTQLHVFASPPLAYFALIRPFATQRSSNKWGSHSLFVCALSSSAANSLCNCVVSFCVPAAARASSRAHTQYRILRRN